MSAGITANTIQGVVATYTGALGTGVTQPLNVNVPNGQGATQFANGTGASQVSAVAVAAGRALSASTPVTDDLSALASPYVGPTTNFTATGVKILQVTNNEAVGSGRNLTFSGGATNPFVGPLGGTTPTYAIGPGETMQFVAQASGGWTVDGTHKAFKLDPGANPVNCTIVVLG